MLSESLAGESAHVMGKVKRSSGLSAYSWEWPNRSYWIATPSSFDHEPTMVAGTRSLVVPRR